jgi:hypothetical protein
MSTATKEAKQFLQRKKKKVITCPNGCTKEDFDEQDMLSSQMFSPTLLDGPGSVPEYNCIICGMDAVIV